jgi:uncharacterized protein YcfJ
MNKSMLIGTVFGVAAATAVGGMAGYSMLNGKATDNEAATPATAQAAAENCYQAQVERPADPKDKNRVAGTVIGALVGGAVGKDVGDRDITTAAGAAAGALAGNQIQKRMQEQRTVTTTETRCDPATNQP